MTIKIDGTNGITLPNGSNKINYSGLVNLLYPSLDGNHRDLNRAGFRPAGFNQQWGGAQWGCELVNGATGNLHRFDVATGYIEDGGYGQGSSATLIGYTAAVTYAAQGFRVSENISPPAIWVKLSKVGNPANNLNLVVYSDNGSGLPSAAITNGASTAQIGKLHTSKPDGEWYRFVFPTAPALTANTQYHLVLSSSGAVDSVNYWVASNKITPRYPLGNRSYGDATPTWTADTGRAYLFLVENSVTKSFLQPGGQFNSQLVFSQGAPTNQSKALTANLKAVNFDGVNFTALFRTKAALKGNPIADFVYGLDHDRIQVMCNATTGYASVNFWQSDRTLVTLTSAVDVSVGSLSDIAITGRFAGDGADYLELWVNGVKAASTSAATYTLSRSLHDLGHLWVGGGFPVAPTWTQDMQMTSLPSAQGWTFTTGSAVTGIESSMFSIQNNKLFQNKNGFAAGDYAYYVKTTVFSNTTGWTVIAKLRVPSNTNTTFGRGAWIRVNDGSKSIDINIAEYFLQTGVSSADFTYQTNCISKERVVLVTGKGSDYFVYIDGVIAIDGTGKLTNAVTENSIYIGDATSASGENADAIWSYLKYYQGGMLTPQAATGMSLHEAGLWAGQQTSLLSSLYSSGTPVSIKQYCGVPNNYVQEVEWTESRRGVTNGPSTTSTSYVVEPEMECFFIGSFCDIKHTDTFYNNTAATALYLTSHIDGAQNGPLTAMSFSNASYSLAATLGGNSITSSFGLHKYESKWEVSSGTGTSSAVYRALNIKAKS